VDDATTNFVWDGSDIIYQSGATTDRYVRGVGLIKSDVNGFYLYNAHGDVTGLTNASGAVTKNYRYDSFGNEVGIDENDTNPFRYCSEFFDKETGTIYLRHRYYNPLTSRMMSEDPARNGLNWYTYCSNDPVRFFDPSGQSAEDVTRWLARQLIGNPVNNWFTKNGWFSDVFRLAGFVRTKDLTGTYIYHATMDCLQQYGGYNDFYDSVFYYATSMAKEKFQFTSGGQELMLWAWKGDYVNLGAGAELGIYYGGAGGHWLVDKSLAMKMAMFVEYTGYKNNQSFLIAYTPTEKQWWITGFNPKYQNVNAGDLTVYFVLWFNDTGMFNAFRASVAGDSRWSLWSANDPRSVVLRF